MELTEEKKIDLIEILSNNNIQVRECIEIKKNGEVIASNFHRYVLQQGEDINNQPQKIKDIAEVLWK